MKTIMMIAFLFCSNVYAQQLFVNASSGIDLDQRYTINPVFAAGLGVGIDYKLNDLITLQGALKYEQIRSTYYGMTLFPMHATNTSFKEIQHSALISTNMLVNLSRNPGQNWDLNFLLGINNGFRFANVRRDSNGERIPLPANEDGVFYQGGFSIGPSIKKHFNNGQAFSITPAYRFHRVRKEYFFHANNWADYNFVNLELAWYF